jgi:hypothetical protein
MARVLYEDYFIVIGYHGFILAREKGGGAVMGVNGEPEKDPDLPATMTFISIFGAIIAIGWIGMFLLLRSRW